MVVNYYITDIILKFDKNTELSLKLKQVKIISV